MITRHELSPRTVVQSTSFDAYRKYDEEFDFPIAENAKSEPTKAKGSEDHFKKNKTLLSSKKKPDNNAKQRSHSKWVALLLCLTVARIIFSFPLPGCSDKLNIKASERAPLIVNLGRGTTGTRSFTKAICSLGVSSVHFNKYCVSSSNNKESFYDVPDEVMVGLTAHYNLRDQFNKVSRDCLTMGTSCPNDVIAWAEQMKSYVDVVVSSDIGAVLDTPYPFMMKYVIDAAERERGIPPVLVMTEREANSWAVSRLMKNDHNCIICKEHLKKYRTSDGNFTDNDYEGVFDILSCIERAQERSQNITTAINFRDIFMNTRAIDYIQKAMILEFVENAFNYYQVSLQSKAVYNINMFERNITTSEMAKEVVGAISSLPRDSKRRLRHVRPKKTLKTGTLKGEILELIKDGARPLRTTRTVKAKLNLQVNSDNDDENITATNTTADDNKMPVVANSSSFQRTSDQAPMCDTIGVDDINYTLVTQLSQDRLWMLNQHCNRWKGPIAIAIFTDKTVDEIQKTIDEESVINGGIACGKGQVTINTIPKQGKDEDEYPVNQLRNLALSSVQTSHVMYVDIDFWASSNLYGTLQTHDIREKFAHNHKQAVVVPSFMMNPRFGTYPTIESRTEKTNSMPKGFAEVKEAYNNFGISIFGSIRAQSSTDYNRWFEQEAGTVVDIPCFKSTRYEPFMAFRYCKDLPPFQEVFTGYGKNKITQIVQMRHTGYSFSQLGGSYLIHFPHGMSSSKEKWSQRPETSPQKLIAQGQENALLEYKHGQVDKLYLEFQKWLAENVTMTNTTALCEDHLDDDEGIWASSNTTRV